MKNKIQNNMGYLIAGTVVLGSLLMAGGTAFAANTMPGQRGMGGHAPGVFGTVSAINGTTVTVASKGFGKSTTATTYSVDASSATVTKNGAASSLGNVSVGDTVVIVGTVNGTNVTATTIRDGVMMGRGGMGMGRGSGVMGTVASINGNTLTVTSKMGPGGAAAATYTVDDSKATVMKAGASSTAASIAVGDTVMVQGTVAGTNVAATSIRDGMPGGQRAFQNATPVIQGNGQPVIGGTVTAVSGATLTVTNKSNITYTVDATSATVAKGNVVSSVANIVVGDAVVVQGTVNGTSVTASSVMDSGAPAAATSTSGTPQKNTGGFFGGVGSFFHKLFGFF